MKKKDILTNQIHELIKQGLTVKEISVELGMKREAIYHHIAKIKIQNPNLKVNKIRLKDIEKKILELAKQRIMHKDIAIKLNMPTGRVTYIIERLRKLGYEIPRPAKTYKRKIDETDYKILELKRDGQSIHKIAKLIGLSSTTVVNRINKMKEFGIYTDIPNVIKPRNPESIDIDNKILELLSQKLSINDIANTLGKSAGNVSSRIIKMRNNGIEIPGDKEKKEKKENENLMILKLAKEEKTQAQIAKILNLNQPTVALRIRKMRKAGINVPSRKNRLAEDYGEDNKNIQEYEVEEQEILKELGITIEQVQQSGINSLDIKILKLRNDGYTLSRISEEVKISITSISNRINRMKMLGINVPESNHRKGKTEPDEVDRMILKYLEQKISIKEISTIININEKRIYKRISRMRKIGIKLPADKIKEEENQAIINLVREGKSCTQISEELYLNPKTISSRINRLRKKGYDIPMKYKTKTSNMKSETEKTEVSKQDYIEALVNLTKTRNATPEQLRIIADYYGIDMSSAEKYYSSKDEMER